ncbi:MAG: primosomal protein N' [Phycisphaerae bacterium]|nr:primosomal protein N' [Phycisphaerae bacterium]
MEGLFPQSRCGYVRVAVERGLDRYPSGLTYALDDELADVAVGERVIVPLGRGNSRAEGYVVETFPEVESPAQIKHVLQRDPGAPKLPTDLLKLAEWIANYYLAPLGPTIAGMLPSAVRRGTGSVTLRLIDLPELPGTEPPRLTPKQQGVIDALQSLSSEQRPVERRKLATMSNLKTCGPIDRLVASGCLVETKRTAIDAAWRQATPSQVAPPQPTDAQQSIIDGITQELEAGFSAHLLRGVTGSGKTEVYLRLIDQVIRRQRIALLLVPEISLTPQTGGRLMSRFPERRIAVLHSGLTDAQRNQQWAKVASDDVDIVIGARSAVLAPLSHERLGIVIVDEEHDQSYKQDATPRYHGRDVAVRLAHMAECPVLLGSATPSIESWANATRRGTYHLHELDERAPGLTVPRIQLVDMTAERRRQQTNQGSPIGPTLEQALEDTLQSGGQALLLLNRRGFASYLACRNRSCGWVLTCDQCDVTMVMHRHRDLPRGGFVRCHHCLSEQRVPKSCAACGGAMGALGLGTQRIEESLASRFEGLESGSTLRRIDSDTMRTAEDLHSVLEAFGKGTVRVLLGTQMIAKGLDYPGVRLVGVIDADTAINLPDFRASERTFQLVAQVCGRCGRSNQPGRAIIQTFNPEAPAIRLAADNRYRPFADSELEDRLACGLPPGRRMARLVIQDRDEKRCQSLSEDLRHALQSIGEDQVEIRGPVDCVISRLSGRFRRQIELYSESAPALHRTLATTRARGFLEAADRVTIDIDPISLM